MGKPWFGAKRYGYGLSPISWEGWAVTLFWVALMGVGGRMLPSRLGSGWTLAAMLALLVVYLAVVGLKSDGKPWRWRWGRHGEPPI